MPPIVLLCQSASWHSAKNEDTSVGWGSGGCSSGWGVTHHGDQRVLTRRTASSSSPRPRQMPRDPHATSCHSSLLAHTRATHIHEGSPHTQIYSVRPRGTGVVSEEDAYGNTGKDTHGTGLFPGGTGTERRQRTRFQTGVGNLFPFTGRTEPPP